MKNKKTILTISLIILAISAGGLWYFQNQTSNNQEIFQEQKNTGEVIIVDSESSISDSGTREEGNANSRKEFVNVKYKYSFSYPDFAYISDTRMIQEPETSERIAISDSNIKEYSILEISVVKNTLGMSAIEFAQKSLALARQNENDIYYGEKISKFKGEDSFEYIAENGFEEVGLAIDGKGNSLWDEKAGNGRLLYVPFQIIYLDHNDYLWRIMYARDNKIAQETIKSFSFAD